MSDIGLTAPIKDGLINYKASDDNLSTENTRGTSRLGKDAFLQLLVCEMQNQDPLEPSTNTEYIAQLATFSQLEEMQNLSAETQKSQAFSLVGRYVILKSEDSNGNTTYSEGTVDSVNSAGGKVSLIVNGQSYEYDQIYSVVSDEYTLKENRPHIDETYKLTYNANEPEGAVISADFGKNGYVASEAAVIVGGTQLDSSQITCRDGKIIIKPEAFESLENGTYPVTVVFNDPSYTQIADKVTLQVYNSKVDNASKLLEG